MIINPKLNYINRTNTVVPGIGKPMGKRLHACERTEYFPEESWNNFLSTLTQEDFINYPNEFELRSQLAYYHGVEPENIMLFSGGDGALNAAISAFTVPKSTILVPEFYFPMYDVYAAQNECELAFLTYNGLKLTSKPKDHVYRLGVIVVGNPNSPVGDSPSEELFYELEKYHVPIIVDSVYADFGCTKLNVLSKLEQNYIFVHSFSKSFGGAGARIGYAIASEKILGYMAKLRPMFSATGPSIKFAIWALNCSADKTYIKDIIAVREEIQKIYPWNIGGNWVHLPYNKFNDKFVEAGFSFKDNCRLPSVTDLRLIRISTTRNLLPLIR